jgi:integrase
MRKGELCGLRWTDVDFDAGKVWVVQQLTKPGPAPTFGPPKGGVSRKVTVSAQTMDLLRAHKREQATLKMANRTTYHDLGLTFAKEYADLTNRRELLGCPLQSNNLAERQFKRLIKAAKVKPHHVPRHATHLRDLTAPAGGSRACRLRTPRARRRRHDVEDIRPRPARAAAPSSRNNGCSTARVAIR